MVLLTVTILPMKKVVLPSLLISVILRNNSNAETRGFVSPVPGIATAMQTAKMGVMSHQLAVKSSVLLIISSVIIQSASSSLGFAMGKMTVGMALMKTAGTPVGPLRQHVLMMSGCAPTLLGGVLHSRKFVMEKSTVRMEQTRDLHVEWMHVPKTDVLTSVRRPLWAPSAPVLPVSS